jgi:hypothetical protein
MKKPGYLLSVSYALARQNQILEKRGKSQRFVDKRSKQ